MGISAVSAPLNNGVGNVRATMQYSYSQNTINRTTTVVISSYLLGTQGIDGMVIDFADINYFLQTLTIGSSSVIRFNATNNILDEFVSTFIGSYSRTFQHDASGYLGNVYIGITSNCNSTSVGTTLNIPNIYVQPGPATIAWMDNFTVIDAINVGINNPGNYEISAYLYINGVPDVVTKSNIVGTFTWYFTLAEIDAIFNAMGDNTSCSFQIFLVSTEITSSSGTCYKPTPSQVNLSNPTFNVGEERIINSGRGTTDFRHTISMEFMSLDVIIAENVNASYVWDTAFNNYLYNVMTALKTNWGAIVQKTYYGSNLIGQTYANFTANITDANPTFTDFTYIDTNVKTIALTDSDLKIIKGYSNIKATVSVLNKASAIKGATMIGGKYTFKNGTKPQIDANYSDTLPVDITMDGVNNSTLEIYATDSRQNSTKAAILVSTANFLEYNPINILLGTVARGIAGTGTAVTLTFNGTIWNKTFGTVMNSIKTCSYKYKQTTDIEWITGTSVLTPVLSGDTYSCSASIKGDLEAAGFDTAYSYDIQILISDQLTDNFLVPYNITLQSATPQLAFGIGEGVCAGGFYDVAEGGALQVKGKQVATRKGCAVYNGFITTEFTTTYATYTDVYGASCSITTYGESLKIAVALPFAVNTRTATIAVRVNNVDYAVITTNSSSYMGLTGAIIITGLPAGTYTIQLRMRVQVAGDIGYISPYKTLSIDALEV